MTKSNLKNRMVVEFRNGNRYMVVDEHLIGRKEYIPMECYNDNLTAKNFSELDIVKIFNQVTVFESLQSKYLEKIWERQEPKKLTLKEVENILGYPVKIVEVKEMTIEEKREKLIKYCLCRSCNWDQENECPLFRQFDFSCHGTKCLREMDNKGIEKCYEIVFGTETKKKNITEQKEECCGTCDFFDEEKEDNKPFCIKRGTYTSEGNWCRRYK